MNITVPVKAAQPDGVSVVLDERGLESFRDAACAAAIWYREVPGNVMKWLSNLEQDRLPSGRVVLQANAVEDTVRHLCDIAEMPTCQHRDWLIADISDLSKCFAVLMGAPNLRLRLQAVATNACRRFHLDAITGRLVCTYRGTGTQYGVARQGQGIERKVQFCQPHQAA